MIYARTPYDELVEKELDDYVLGIIKGLPDKPRLAIKARVGLFPWGPMKNSKVARIVEMSVSGASEMYNRTLRESLGYMAPRLVRETITELSGDEDYFYGR